MPAVRKRYTEDDKPAPCIVRITPDLAKHLYREKRVRGYRDETELVHAIIRAWVESEKLEPVDWSALLAELKAGEE